MMHYHFCDSCSFIYSLKASIPRIQVWPSCVLPLSSLGDFSQVDTLCYRPCRDEFSTSLCGAHTQVPDYLLGTSTCTACKQLKADMFELCSLTAWSSPCIPVLMNGAPASGPPTSEVTQESSQSPLSYFSPPSSLLLTADHSLPSCFILLRAELLQESPDEFPGSSSLLRTHFNLSSPLLLFYSCHSLLRTHH